MRILHLFSMAGVGEILCKYGAGDKVLQLEQFDPFGFSDYYKVTEMFKDAQSLLKRAEEIQHEYDKIAIHDYSEFKQMFPKNKVILIFHGTKLREMDQVEKSAVSTYPSFVTTQDLLENLPTAKYLPAPIDLELFKDNGLEKGDDYFCINRSYQRKYIENVIKQKYPKVEYYERNHTNIIDYEDMPHFLEQHSNYVDMKFDYGKPEPKLLPNLSLTGLQAMAVGCTVWNGNGQVQDRNLLHIHDARRVSQGFLKEFD